MTSIVAALVSTLRKTTVDHVKTIEEFVVRSTETLSRKPTSIAEVGEANKQHEEISARIPTVRAHFELAATKNRLLKQTIGSNTGMDIAVIKERWDKFEILLESM